MSLMIPCGGRPSRRVQSRRRHDCALFPRLVHGWQAVYRKDHGLMARPLRRAGNGLQASLKAMKTGRRQMHCLDYGQFDGTLPSVRVQDGCRRGARGTGNCRIARLIARPAAFFQAAVRPSIGLRRCRILSLTIISGIGCPWLCVVSGAFGIERRRTARAGRKPAAAVFTASCCGVRTAGWGSCFGTPENAASWKRNPVCRPAEGGGRKTAWKRRIRPAASCGRNEHRRRVEEHTEAK